MADELKDWIDNASYEQLFRRWRTAPSGDPMFQGKIGEYYSEVMKAKRIEVGDAEHTRISKMIGW
ncbi:hypothetical protein KAR91_31685 [Candidatus Pacearchaeota archaeon]|nr:hypothetical protein [Candidatus Pacearchaeota archaeon]